MTKPRSHSFADNVRADRQFHGVTLDAVSRTTNLTIETIRAIEAGTESPPQSLPLIEAWAVAVNGDPKVFAHAALKAWGGISLSFDPDNLANPKNAIALVLAQTWDTMSEETAIAIVQAVMNIEAQEQLARHQLPVSESAVPA